MPDQRIKERAKRTSYTATCGTEILTGEDRLDWDGKSALLRRKGLYNSLSSQ